LKRTTGLDALFTVGLVVAGAVLHTGFEAHFGIHGPFGSDPQLWVLSAWNLTVGAVSVTPPLFPMLLTILERTTRLDMVESGLFVSAFFGVLLPAGTYATSRFLGATPLRALLGAILVLGTAALGVLGSQLQPDSLTVLLLLVTSVVCVAFVRNPGWLGLSGLAALAAVAPLAREHGLVVAMLAAALAFLAPGSLVRRASRLGVVLGALCLGPVLTGGHPCFPWATPWSDRVQMTVGTLDLGQLPTNVVGLGREGQERMTRYYEQGNILGIFAFDVVRSLSGAPGAWAWVAFGFLASLRLGPKVAPNANPWLASMAIATGLVPVLPGLLVWSQPRHVIVAVPVAVAVVSAATFPFTGWPWHWSAPKAEHEDTRLAWWLGGVLPVLVLALVTIVSVAREVPHWEVAGRRLSKEQSQLDHVKAFGHALCGLAGEGDLLAGEIQQAGLYCPLPRTELSGWGNASDWHAFVVGPKPPSEAWKIVNLGEPVFSVYRLRPDLSGDARPCASSRPDPATPYAAAHPRVAVMEPFCAEKIDLPVSAPP
jgi:hypothetical protein